MGLLPEFERLQTVRQDVPGELALMREPRAAVHAREEARRALVLTLLLQNKRPSTSFRLTDRMWRKHYFQAFLRSRVFL